MRFLYKLVAFIAISLFVGGCGGGGSLDEPQKVVLKGGELIADFPANILKDDLVKKKLIDANKSVFGFRAYKVPYTTTDDEGNRVKASGVVVIPSSLGVSSADKDKLTQMKFLGLSMVLDNHGTIFANKEAPSVSIAETMMPEGAAVIYSSLAGFITMQPDYIGFGDSKEHYHPYLIKKSSATATVDFYKAAKKFIQDNNLTKVNDGIYLSGYSQGGYVALAALEKLENEGIKVNIAAPMAGPYLLDPIAQGVLSLDTIKAPSFMAAVAYAYSKRYNKDVKELIQEPYASKLPKLFDSKKYTREEIDKALTTKVKGDGGLFTNEIVQNYAASWFRVKLLSNSLVSYAPSSPIKLLHCEGDDIIPYAISKNEEIILNSLGANSVTLVPVEATLGLKEKLGHVECALKAYSIANHMFATHRKAVVGY